jgi:hypothetical protein
MSKGKSRMTEKSMEHELHDFMFGVETSAKKILKAHNKRRVDEAARYAAQHARPVLDSAPDAICVL